MSDETSRLRDVRDLSARHDVAHELSALGHYRMELGREPAA